MPGMRRFLALPMLLLATPALAQFPPPGVYACSSGDTAFGELTLLVAGDYAFKSTDGTNQSGQIASAGSSIDVLSGPLLGFKGAFATDDTGTTIFQFTGTDGSVVTCT